MDLFSRKIIGWNLSSKHDVDLVKTAFEKAYEKRKYSKNVSKVLTATQPTLCVYCGD